MLAQKRRFWGSDIVADYPLGRVSRQLPKARHNAEARKLDFSDIISEFVRFRRKAILCFFFMLDVLFFGLIYSLD